jgi:hypothetical protein
MMQTNANAMVFPNHAVEAIVEGDVFSLLRLVVSWRRRDATYQSRWNLAGHSKPRDIPLR